jgi:hypothetical protein
MMCAYVRHVPNRSDPNSGSLHFLEAVFQPVAIAVKMLLNAILMLAFAGPAAAWWDVYVSTFELDPSLPRRSR